MTTRSLLASLVCSLTLIACGDDGNNNRGDDGDGNELCGNGTLDGGESCDDRNDDSNDGCSNCTIDSGYNCQGSPSVCIMGEFPDIQDGSCATPFIIELTDNGSGLLTGTADGDTTGATDHVAEADCGGFDSGGANDLIFSFTISVASDVDIIGPDPSPFDMALRLATTACSVTTQVPDDVGDGCSDSVFSEELHYTALPPGTYFLTVDGYQSGEVGAFTVAIQSHPTTCGDGVVDVDEECDDDELNPNDGCSAACTVEFGYICDGEPSVCELACGNGVIDDDLFEECDDGDDDPSDGCDEFCEIELGYTCEGEPSVCELQCGNGDLVAGEECDDDDNDAGDGCSATCLAEPGYVCIGEPSACAMTCGNNVINAGEECDDGDAIGADGCSDNCQIEPGYVCAGTPSTCTNTCGNDTTDANEECDDGGILNGDFCSDNCKLEFDVSEVENNNTTPQSVAFIEGDTFIRSSFSTAGDVDLYQVTLTDSAYVEVETYNTIDASFSNYDGIGFFDVFDCVNSMDTQILVFPQGVDYSNASLALGSGDDDGDGTCSYFGSRDLAHPAESELPAGTYVIKVTNSAAAPIYMIDLYVEYEL